MVGIILTIFLVLLVVLFLWKNIIKPKKLFYTYISQIQGNKKYKLNKYNFVNLNADVFLKQIKCYQEKKDSYYDLKHLASNYDLSISNFGDRVFLEFISPQLIKSFYEIDSNPKLVRKYQLITTQLKRMVGNGITFSEGQDWKHKRKIMTQFLNFNFIKSVSQKIYQVSLRKIEQFYNKNVHKNQQNSQQEFSQFYLQQLLENIFSTVVAQIFFGGGNQKVDQFQIDGKSLPTFMRDLLQEIFFQTINPLSVVLGQKFVKLGLRQRDRKCNKMLSSYKNFTKNFVLNRLWEIQKMQSENVFQKQKNPKDLIEAFYFSLKPEELGNKKIKQKFIKDLIQDFATLYTAGTDTTQHHTLMLIYNLIKNPKIKQKIIEQIAINVKQQKLNYESLKNLTYLQAVVMETLRTYSTANGIFPREALQDFQLGSIHIRKGTILTSQTITTHYKSELYQNPIQFKPQRWIQQENKIKSPQSFTMMSFSAGSRSCIGKQLALTQMKLFTIQFLRNYKMQLQDKPFDMNVRGFAYEPQPLKIKIWKVKKTQ